MMMMMMMKLWLNPQVGLFTQRVCVRVRLFTQRVCLGLSECYRLLRLNPDTQVTRAQVRDSYLRLAKLHHPDSGATTADPALFSQIERAYRVVVAHLERRATRDEDEEGEEERKTARYSPQHRHYLSYEGVGSGTPGQREKRYWQLRVGRAAQQVGDYRQKAACGPDEASAVSVRSHTGITQAVERLVEDLIQESMARGDFLNLRGTGQPLNKFDHNPYADPMTHNLNRILIDSGYQPQWVVAQKEIRQMLGRLRAGLLEARTRLGEAPGPAQLAVWQESCQAFSGDLVQLNRMVDDFNLVVPLLSKQMVHFSLQRELHRAEREYRADKGQPKAESSDTSAAGKDTGRPAGFLSWIQSLLKWT